MERRGKREEVWEGKDVDLGNTFVTELVGESDESWDATRPSPSQSEPASQRGLAGRSIGKVYSHPAFGVLLGTGRVRKNMPGGATGSYEHRVGWRTREMELGETGRHGAREPGR